MFIEHFSVCMKYFFYISVASIERPNIQRKLKNSNSDQREREKNNSYKNDLCDPLAQALP